MAIGTYNRKYNNFILVGDFNCEECEPSLDMFLNDHNAKNLVKEKTCFKNILNPTCIDLIIKTPVLQILKLFPLDYQTFIRW